MKGGLRRQFQKILTDPLITYLGHVTISNNGNLTVRDLASRGFDALVYAIGAQGTKYLGVEGERLPGVYHAKDLVYHYNRLPPFSERPFPMGRRVAIVGVGNVMVDIANYCAHFAGGDEIIAIARRGPFEKAYDDREFEDVEDAFDHALHREEIERIRPRLLAAGQNPDELLAALRPSPSVAAGPRPSALPLPRLAQARGRRGGRVVGLEVEENRLERKGDRITAVGTGATSVIPADTVVFGGGRPRRRGRGSALQGRALSHRPRRGSGRRVPGARSRRREAQPGVFVVGFGAPATAWWPRAADAETGISTSPATSWDGRSGRASRRSGTSTRCAARSPSGAPPWWTILRAAARGGEKARARPRTGWKSSSSAATRDAGRDREPGSSEGLSGPLRASAKGMGCAPAAGARTAVTREGAGPRRPPNRRRSDAAIP
jgi:hypothetical protein